MIDKLKSKYLVTILFWLVEILFCARYKVIVDIFFMLFVLCLLYVITLRMLYECIPDSFRRHMIGGFIKSSLEASICSLKYAALNSLPLIVLFICNYINNLL